MTIALRYAAYSDVGHLREGNEDSGYAGPHLLAVADGMGGYEGGEIASSIAISALQPLDGDTLGSEMVEVLRSALDQANQAIAQQVVENARLENMGTTITAMLWSGSRFALIHVGDSRAYRLRDGEFGQITHDHTLVQTLVDEGKITEEEVATHPQRSLILRALNGQGEVDPDIQVSEAQVGDRFLLCSDGLSGVVSKDTIGETLSTEENLDAAARRLIDLANRGGGPDNITAVLAEVVDTARDPKHIPTNSVVVGAADQRREPPMIPDTPAGRAQGLSRSSSDTAEMDPIRDVPDEGDAEPEYRTYRWWPMVLGFVVVLALVLGGAYYFGKQWLDNQYFIGPDDDETNIAVYRGINSTVLGISLAYDPVDTGIPLDHLPDQDQARVSETINFDSREAADDRVEELRSTAEGCAADPGSCGIDPPSDADTEAPAPQRDSEAPGEQ
ncbi:Stp1/IreP family PP2C-type Ser/Thr phosphatase [Spiractinospora alimapuensis]|uniref:Stp1/IreP family PP2C-type Ser/Thr phosphatase n=1 Tax=Spiractinospora alimapuensis TaxID=2820884 RepID=UPI001EECB762|nr:Stp1/IreP family PP2C-type Ser/Thr phosphatase [Spiractinospora alimapuensis]QVQ50451.1 Stp1/IreP family PP2C-type Ser/Thr phosphatase [Spiractinospora alimapuensis]